MSCRLVEVVRSEHLESIHHGSIVIVGPEGAVLHQAGLSDDPVFFHSSAKPIQGIAALEAGIAEAYGLDLGEIAVMISSHSGESPHIKVLEGILKKLGIGEETLECGIADPVGKNVAKELYTAGKTLSKLHCNCSGKHLGMIAASKLKGYSLDDYYRSDHPIQQKVRDIIGIFSGTDGENMIQGIDGCSVPVYGLPLKNMAYAYANLCRKDFCGGKYNKSQNYIISAMTMYPEMIAGDGRIDTVMMKNFGDRLVGKIGAEGVFCVGLIGKGTGIAVKIEDGNTRAVEPVIMEVIRQLGIISDDEAEKNV